MSKTRARGFDRRLLDGLEVLGVVVEAGSFVGAGEALGLTQSAVSRAVARLEDRIGVRLFRRTARAISLTDEGRRFHESIAPHLAAIVDATTEAGGSAGRVRGRLRVNVDAGIGRLMLTPHLQPSSPSTPISPWRSPCEIGWATSSATASASASGSAARSRRP